MSSILLLAFSIVVTIFVCGFIFLDVPSKEIQQKLYKDEEIQKTKKKEQVTILQSVKDDESQIQDNSQNRHDSQNQHALHEKSAEKPFENPTESAVDKVFQKQHTSIKI